MMGFRDYEPAVLRIPNRGPFGQQLAAACGALRDEEIALTRLALLSRIPSRCPDDALDALGRFFRIERYAAETDASYRGRLEVAWETWENAGSDEGIETQIAAAFGCDVRVWPIWDADFGPDPRAAYSEFWIIIGPALGTYTGTSAQKVALKRIILKWKSTHGYPVEILVLGGAGPVLGWGVVGSPAVQPLTLGAFALGGATVDRIRIGRTMNGTLPPLGDAGFILGGYDLA